MSYTDARNKIFRACYLWFGCGFGRGFGICGFNSDCNFGCDPICDCDFCDPDCDCDFCDSDCDCDFCDSDCDCDFCGSDCDCDFCDSNCDCDFSTGFLLLSESCIPGPALAAAAVTDNTKQTSSKIVSAFFILNI